MYAKADVAASLPGKTRTIGENGKKLFGCGLYGASDADDTWKVEPPGCAKLPDKSIRYADQAVAREGA